MPKVIAFVSNGISASLLHTALANEGIGLDDVCLISGRRLPQAWTGDCAASIEFSKKPALNLAGQAKALGFYRKAARGLKTWLRDPALEQIFIANSDNLLSSHLLIWAERHPGIRLSVLAEGNMNYQPVTRQNRARWRWWAKPPMAFLLGLRYRAPKGHLSGAFEPRVDRVISYAARHLQAPAEKVEILPFPPVERKLAPDPDGLLILLTGIGQWMKKEDFAAFSAAFGRWVKSLGARRIWVKPHPNYPSGGIEEGLGAFEYLDDPRSIEEIAGEIPAGRVVGYWSTALVTLKLIRPDLDCIDFGHDFYASAAYHGDMSIAPMLEAAGVELVEMAPWAGRDASGR